CYLFCFYFPLRSFVSFPTRRSSDLKFLKAFHRRNRFVISFFSRRSSCWSILVAEPVIRWPPHVRTRHVNTAPGAIHMRNGIYYRSEEHTSELQSRGHLVCRLLLEKK